ncbi:MAG TPA: AlkA N-terminal domain-containing protein [Steroidobacteraceae bacterium]|nr:AlkA N-terminal domain-containing protein [Steroidobacteraceae bacterium]
MNEVPGLTRAALHRARISRDARFDGKFYIAVLTTGIYCRPICPAPRCRKSNVRYYATAAAAAAAGYRPCRRCRPEVAPGSAAWLGPSAVVRRALRLIQQGALDDGTVEELATRVGVGARHLDRLFAEHVGVPPIAVAQTRRLHFAKQLLDETNLPITQVAMTAGFGSLRRFNEAYRTAYRCTPRGTRQRRRTDPAPGRDEEVSLTLSYRPPYDFGRLAEFLRARALRGVERADAGGYARTIRLGRRYARIRVAPLAKENALRLTVSRAEPGDLFEIATTARRAFDLSADPAPIAAVLSADPLLAPLVRRCPGLRVPGVWDTFECAVRAIVSERMSVAAARRLTERLVERCGERIGDSPEELTCLFPSAERLASADLTDLGLAAGKRAGLRSLARAVRDGRLELDAPAEQLVAALAALAGVGPWVAQYVALRALGEPDAFPRGDLALRRAVAGASGTLPVAALARRAEGWRPWRGYATLHLWRKAADGSGGGARRARAPPNERRSATAGTMPAARPG